MKRTVILLAMLVIFLAFSPTPAFSQVREMSADAPPLQAYSIIQLINETRTNSGLPALAVDPVLMGTAQATADSMAAAQLHAHIGDVVGRVKSAGYGSGKIFATESFAMLKPGENAQLMSRWADAAHQIPMVDPNYRHIGAGVALSANGFYYYVVHAAYSTGGSFLAAATSPSGSPAVTATSISPSEYIYGVTTVTPQFDGKLVHTVLQGQSLWSIAIAYHTKIVEILRLNNLPSDFKTTFQGQKLVIPTSSEIPPTAAASLTPTQAPEAPTRAVTPAPAALFTPTPTPILEPVIPASIVPNVLIGLVFSVLGILAMYGAFSSRRR